MLARLPALAVEPLEPRAVPAAPFATLPVVPANDPAVADTVRAIVARGQLHGRTPNALFVAGDSNSTTVPVYSSGFLSGFGRPGYDPVGSGLAALRPDLLETLAVYRAGGSFSRPTGAAFLGYQTANLLATVPGEIAGTNAGLALVMIGTNEIAGFDPAVYRDQLRQLIGMMTGAGIVPILSTIPPNVTLGGAYSAAVPLVNQAIADVAGDAHLPVWNLWRGLTGLPGAGLIADGTHLSVAGDGVTFAGGGLVFGQNLRNLEALDVLAWFRRTVAGPVEIPALPAWSPLHVGEAVFATGRDTAQAAVVTVFDAAGRLRNRFLAFGPDFTGGVRVATADVTGDGVPDVVAGAGVGGAPAVKVFSGADGSEVASFFAFEPSFRSGVSVAAADFDGDGMAEIVTGAGDGGGPAVAVFRGRDFAEAARFFAYEPSFRGGVNVAAGEVAGVGPAIVTGAGFGGGPVVKVFRLGEAEPVASYMAYDSSVRSGVVVTVTDLDGTGGAVATAPAQGAPHVKLTDATTGTVRASFFALVTGGDGLRLGALRGAGTDALLIANGPGGGVETWAYRGETADPLGLSDPLRAYGVYVG